MFIYFDNAASTKPYDEVLKLFSDLSNNFYSNPHSLHTAGLEADCKIKEASLSLAQDLNCLPEELIYTSGASESINQAIKGSIPSYIANKSNKEIKIVTLKTEHKATLNTLKYLESILPNLKVVYWPQLADGSFNPSVAEEILTPNVKLITMSSINNVIGFSQNLKLLNHLRNAYCKNALIHIDHVQAWGKIKINLNDSGIDMASFAAHKIHAIKGVGLLYLRKNTHINPLIHGSTQQKNRRAGTPNMPGVVAMAKASSINEKNLIDNYNKVSYLKKILLNKLNSTNLNYTLHSTKDCLPYILSISFPGVMSETLVNALSENGIYLGAQSACSSGITTNYVLDSLGKPQKESMSSIRISLDPDHTEADISYLVSKLNEIINRLLNNK